MLSSDAYTFPFNLSAWPSLAKFIYLPLIELARPGCLASLRQKTKDRAPSTGLRRLEPWTVELALQTARQDNHFFIKSLLLWLQLEPYSKEPTSYLVPLILLIFSPGNYCSQVFVVCATVARGMKLCCRWPRQPQKTISI